MARRGVVALFVVLSVVFLAEVQASGDRIHAWIANQTGWL